MKYLHTASAHEVVVELEAFFKKYLFLELY